MRAILFALLFGAAAVPAIVLAAEPSKETFVDVPPPPPPAAIPKPDEEEVDPSTEPEVTIIQRKDATYEEYRMNGRLYMVKVLPAVGPAYFFIDRDGDGLMETRMNDRASQIQVPQWVIFSW